MALGKLGLILLVYPPFLPAITRAAVSLPPALLRRLDPSNHIHTQVADVITGIVLGKNVLKMFGGDKRGEGSPDWKEKAADELMKKIKEKEGGADKPDDGPDKP
jgi:hypothetical protein